MYIFSQNNRDFSVIHYLYIDNNYVSSQKFGLNCTKVNTYYFVIMKISKRILFVLTIVMMAITSNAQNGNYVNHTVAQGETLYSISKRYNTTVEEVVKLNPESVQKLSIGQILIIPCATPSNDKSESKSENEHVIQPGQTLYGVSKMYNVNIEDLCNANPGLSTTNFKVGDVIVIPATRVSDTPNEVRNGKTHIIQQGETLYRLSKMYDVTTDEICNANPGLSISNFKIGEAIVIPAKQEDEIKKQDAQNVIANEEVLTTDGEQKEEENEQAVVITHKVLRNENIESICERYNITKEELLNANPILKEKNLKRKMILNIPVSSANDEKETKTEEVAEEVTIKEEVTTNEEQATDNEEGAIEEEEVAVDDEDNYIHIEPVEIEEERIKQGAFNDDKVVNVAVILSFLLDSYAPNEQERLIEYYQGFLMAVEQLKREGHSFVINTFDAGHKDGSLDSLLTSGALDEVELIIGATYAKHNKELAKYAKERKIPLIIPLATKKDEAIDNPMVYIVNGVQQYILPQVSKSFVETFPNANVLFVEDEKSDKKEFIKSLTAQLDQNGIPHTTLPLSEITDEEMVIPALSKVKQNDKELIVIPTSSSATMLKTLMPALLEAKSIDSTQIGKFKLFGYPEWQIHANATRELMYEIDTYIYATFYSHYSLPRVAQFLEEYIGWYNVGIKNLYPRFCMLGYDTGYFFLRAASLYGNDMHEKINETTFDPVQSDFRMERISENDGFVNNSYFFIHYSPEYNIEKIDFNKKEPEKQDDLNLLKSPFDNIYKILQKLYYGL